MGRKVDHRKARVLEVFLHFLMHIGHKNTVRLTLSDGLDYGVKKTAHHRGFPRLRGDAIIVGHPLQGISHPQSQKHFGDPGDQGNDPSGGLRHGQGAVIGISDADFGCATGPQRHGQPAD